MSKSYRKYLAAAVSTSIVASSVAVVMPYQAQNVSASTLLDVEAGSYYYDAVINLGESGIIQGFKDGTFRPFQNVTRGQVAAIIARALNLDGANAPDPGFLDVSQDNIFYDSIAALAEEGIISGVTPDSFQPYKTITRAEMAKMLTKAFDLAENTASSSVFTDVPSNSWYAGFVGALLDNDITQGKTTTTYAPNDPVHRGQIAAFIYRALQNASPTSIIEKVSDTSITINGQTYNVADSLKPILNAANAPVLMNADIKFEQTGGTITSILVLEITADGEESASGQAETSGHLVLDGQGAQIDGDVTIHGDFITVKDLTVKGDLTVGADVENSFLADNLIVEGLTQFADALLRVSKTSMAAIDPAQVHIVLADSILNTVEVSKDGISLDLQGDTVLTDVNVSADVGISAEASALIEKMIVDSGAKAVEINGAVQDLIIDSAESIVLTGSAILDNVKLLQAGDVIFNILGEIKQLESLNKDVDISLNLGATIGSLLFPEGSILSNIFQNFEGIKDHLGKIIFGEPDDVAAPAAPAVEADDENNKILHAENTMEYSTNRGATWTAYDSGNSPTFDGDKTVLVRVKADSLNGVPAGKTTVLTFTNNDTIPPAAPGISIVGKSVVDGVVDLTDLQTDLTTRISFSITGETGAKVGDVLIYKAYSDGAAIPKIVKTITLTQTDIDQGYVDVVIQTNALRNLLGGLLGSTVGDLLGGLSISSAGTNTSIDLSSVSNSGTIASADPVTVAGAVSDGTAANGNFVASGLLGDLVGGLLGDNGLIDLDGVLGQTVEDVVNGVVEVTDGVVATVVDGVVIDVLETTTSGDLTNLLDDGLLDLDGLVGQTVGDVVNGVIEVADGVVATVVDGVVTNVLETTTSGALDGLLVDGLLDLDQLVGQTLTGGILNGTIELVDGVLATVVDGVIVNVVSGVLDGVTSGAEEVTIKVQLMDQAGNLSPETQEVYQFQVTDVAGL